MTQFLIIISTAREQNVSYLQNGTSYAWIIFSIIICILGLDVVGWMKNYNSKREDLEEEDQRQDERNVIL